MFIVCVGLVFSSKNSYHWVVPEKGNNSHRENFHHPRVHKKGGGSRNVLRCVIK